MAANYQKFKAERAEVIAISVDPLEKSRELKDKLGVPFTILSDPDLKVIRRYGVLDPGGKISIASVFLVDTRGVVRWSYVAEDYTVRPPDETLLSQLNEMK